MTKKNELQLLIPTPAFNPTFFKRGCAVRITFSESFDEKSPSEFSDIYHKELFRKHKVQTITGIILEVLKPNPFWIRVQYVLDESLVTEPRLGRVEWIRLYATDVENGNVNIEVWR